MRQWNQYWGSGETFCCSQSVPRPDPEAVTKLQPCNDDVLVLRHLDVSEQETDNVTDADLESDQSREMSHRLITLSGKIFAERRVRKHTGE